jgi:hypothetical protein
MSPRKTRHHAKAFDLCLKKALKRSVSKKSHSPSGKKLSVWQRYVSKQLKSSKLRGKTFKSKMHHISTTYKKVAKSPKMKRCVGIQTHRVRQRSAVRKSLARRKTPSHKKRSASRKRHSASRKRAMILKKKMHKSLKKSVALKKKISKAHKKRGTPSHKKRVQHKKLMKSLRKTVRKSKALKKKLSASRKRQAKLARKNRTPSAKRASANRRRRVARALKKKC